MIELSTSQLRALRCLRHSDNVPADEPWRAVTATNVTFDCEDAPTVNAKAVGALDRIGLAEPFVQTVGQVKRTCYRLTDAGREIVKGLDR